ncbi:MAG: TrkA family potassium uptake protein [Ignavibacteria bacterium]|jgi:trk system potassium uptake protein TrkA|nr:TrkA family potassium uptake protein [Ignavibacteria bacterium]
MSKKFAIIGLGHFGGFLANFLEEKGAEVLAIDSDMNKLEDVKEMVTRAVRLDSTDEKALRTQDLSEYDAVIVGMGDDFEASILTVSILQIIGVKRIIVRATTEITKRILSNLGIKEIILPTEEAAMRVANTLMMDKVINSVLLESDYSIVEMITPIEFTGKTLQQLDLPKNYKVNIVTIKRKVTQSKLLGFGEETFEQIVGIPNGETKIEKDDVLLVFGEEKSIRKLLKKE